MCRWYEHAELCLVYLRDVSEGSPLMKSEWWEHGWTLQQLIAPLNVEFLDKDWRSRGTKLQLRARIAAATNIHRTALNKELKLSTYSVATKMSWAGSRKTSWLEDQAYCLLGLFDINMPLLYGER